MKAVANSNFTRQFEEPPSLSASTFPAPSFWFTAFPLFLTLPLSPSWFLSLSLWVCLVSTRAVCLSLLSQTLPHVVCTRRTLSSSRCLLAFQFYSFSFLSSILICHNWKINYIYILAVFLVLSAFCSEFKGRGNRVYISFS